MFSSTNIIRNFECFPHKAFALVSQFIFFLLRALLFCIFSYSLRPLRCYFMSYSDQNCSIVFRAVYGIFFPPIKYCKWRIICRRLHVSSLARRASVPALLSHSFALLKETKLTQSVSSFVFCDHVGVRTYCAGSFRFMPYPHQKCWNLTPVRTSATLLRTALSHMVFFPLKQMAIALKNHLLLVSFVIELRCSFVGT